MRTRSAWVVTRWRGLVGAELLKPTQRQLRVPAGTSGAVALEGEGLFVPEVEGDIDAGVNRPDDAAVEGLRLLLKDLSM